jgi:hypothetical protein
MVGVTTVLVLVLSGFVVVVMLVKANSPRIEPRSWWAALGLSVLSSAVCSSVSLFGIHGIMGAAVALFSMALAITSLLFLLKGQRHP